MRIRIGEEVIKEKGVEVVQGMDGDVMTEQGLVMEMEHCSCFV
jgi:hypothetical protein